MLLYQCNSNVILTLNNVMAPSVLIVGIFVSLITYHLQVSGFICFISMNYCKFLNALKLDTCTRDKSLSGSVPRLVLTSWMPFKSYYEKML